MDLLGDAAEDFAQAAEILRRSRLTTPWWPHHRGGATTPTPSQRKTKTVTENVNIPGAYANNALLACIVSITGGKLIQKINVTLPVKELTGDYLAGLVAGLMPEDREFFAASLDAQVITHSMTNASAITEPRKGPGPHWISAMYSIDYSDDGEKVIVDVDVISCGC